MVNNYIFREIEKDEVAELFQLILRRIAWMDEVGIRQWNVIGYDKVYPLSYYEQEQQKGTLFVLVTRDTGKIAAGAVLKEKDAFWSDSTPALYLHNFVSRPEEKGAGRLFLRLAEELARRKEKCRFRLDSAADNPSLSLYYESLGFSPVGTCKDGPYQGILREKILCE